MIEPDDNKIRPLPEGRPSLGRCAYFVNGKYIGTVTGGLFSRLVEEVYPGVIVGGKQNLASKKLEVSYFVECDQRTIKKGDS